MEWNRALEFSVAALLIELTPGPNMTYLAVATAGQGVKAGLAVVAGTTIGLAICMVASVFGVSKAVLADPSIYSLLRWSGVAYLAWLAIESWAQSERPAAQGAPARRGIRPFLRGVTANLLNVKSLLFYSAVLPDFIDRDRGGLLTQALFLGAIHLAISVVVHSSIVAAASVRPHLSRRTPSAAVHRTFALALAASAIWLAWATRQSA